MQAALAARGYVVDPLPERPVRAHCSLRSSAAPLCVGLVVCTQVEDRYTSTRVCVPPYAAAPHAHGLAPLHGHALLSVRKQQFVGERGILLSDKS